MLKNEIYIPNAGLIIESYQKFFEDCWDIWLTITFRRVIGTEQALESLRYFFKHINSRDFVFYKGFIRGWVFSEFNENREGVHLHVLIKGIAPEMTSLLEDFCRDYFGDSYAVPYDQSLPKRASGYLAKKCISSMLDNFEPFKINSRFRGKDITSYNGTATQFRPLIQASLPLGKERKK